MPNYIKISYTELSSTTNSVTLSAIPQIYDDLELFVVGDGTGYNATEVRILVNGSSALNYYQSYIQKDGNSSVVTYGTDSGIGYWFGGYVTGSNTLNGAYGFSKTYFPRYSSTGNKTAQCFFCTNSNTADTWIGSHSFRRDVTDAITSLVITAGAANFLAGTTIALYGIKNS